MKLNLQGNPFKSFDMLYLKTQLNLLILVTLILSLGNTACSQTGDELYKGTWKTDTSQRLVRLSEFKTLLRRDGIPPIDKPDFWSVPKARERYQQHEPVMVVSHKDVTRAYPISVLMHHEIVNDELAGKPLTISYCPLCNSGMVFERQLTHEGRTYTLDFGVSGMLRHSDLVMWDRQTESWWQQLSGKALVGKLAGATLKLHPSQTVAFTDFAESHSDAKVLSTNTGHNRSYGTNPYVNYDEDKEESPRFTDKVLDAPLPPKERLVTLKGERQSKVYPYSTVRKREVINDNHEGQPFVIFYKGNTLSALDEKQIKNSRKVGSATVYSRKLDGRVLTFEKAGGRIRDKATNSTWNIQGECIAGELKGKNLHAMVYGEQFAFAWFPFHENTVIYGRE